MEEFRYGVDCQLSGLSVLVIMFVQFRDVDQYTALHRACYEGHVEMAELLIESGSSIEARHVSPPPLPLPILL